MLNMFIEQQVETQPKSHLLLSYANAVVRDTVVSNNMFSLS